MLRKGLGYLNNPTPYPIREKTQLDETATLMKSIEENTLKVNDSMITLQRTTTDIHHLSAAIADIAGQTNLLSLNASIEAARAGEHG